MANRTMRLAILAGVGATLAAGGLAQASTKLVKVTAGPYAGMSSEKAAVTFTVSGRTIRSFKTTIGYNGKCGQGGGPGFNIDASKVSLAKNGTFSATITLVGPGKAVPNHTGTLKGKASGSKVSGTIVDLTTAKFKCNGYTETFTATHK